jgi:T4 gene Gp59 loader of gp41 DNA helicase
MSAFSAYKSYLALRRHFNEDGYDYFRFNGKTNASQTSFEKRKDQFQFAKLAKLPDPAERVLASMSRGLSWIGAIVGTEGEEAHRDWKRVNQSLSYVFSKELLELDPSFNENFEARGGKSPRLMSLFYSKRVSIETVVVTAELSGCMPFWQELVPEQSVVFADFEKLVRKYSPFVKFDREQMREKLLSRYANP